MPSTSTLVLTAAPGSGAVTDALTRAALGALDGSASDARWLSPGDAWEATLDLPLPSPPIAALRDGVARAIGPAAVDVNIVQGEAALRRRPLLVTDMESTIIEQELIDEMAGLAGRREEVQRITAAAMRGELDFAASLVQRIGLFRGFDASLLDGLMDRITLMPGAACLVRTMARNGARTALVSGGFSYFAEEVGRRLGFDVVAANVLEIENGRLTGRVREPILGPDSKAEILKRLAREGGLDLGATLSAGDGANDAVMLAAAGLGVAFRAKPMLVAAMRASPTGAVITHGDLTALLNLQGYGREEFEG